MFLQREELRDVFDYMMYLDVPREVRLKRVLKRDAYIGDVEQIRSKYDRRYFPAESYYIETCRPRESADYVMEAWDVVCFSREIQFDMSGI